MSVVVACALRTGPKIRRAAVASLLAQIRAEMDAGLAGHDVGLRVLNRRAMAEHNRFYRGKRGPTDVISIPADLDDAPLVKDLGDILLCLPVVVADARTHHQSLDERFQLLLVHSMLHLAGHDHEGDEEWQRMLAEEERIMGRLPTRTYFD